MSTPIPEALRKTAQEHVQRWGGDERNVDMVAAAMAARDERAAKIAETAGVYPELNVFAGGPEWYCHGKRIASAIRDRSKT